MNGELKAFAQERQLATGVALLVDLPDLSPQCASEADLDRLVTSYYKLLQEQLAPDITFLMSVERDSSVEKCRRLIRNLRTVAQHTGNPQIENEVANWRANYLAPQAAATELAILVLLAIERLATIAGVVRRDGTLAVRWRDVLLVEPATVFMVVSKDLGLRFPPHKERWMIRQIEGRLKVEPGDGDRRAHVSEFCVQEIVSTHLPLPVPYSEVLDSLNLLGKVGADGALLVAYSVARIAPQLRGEAFIDRVRMTWDAANT